MWPVIMAFVSVKCLRALAVEIMIMHYGLLTIRADRGEGGGGGF